jgi:hypothetical protein
MNTKTNAISAIQGKNNELRELSSPESTKVNGGRACYPSKSGGNTYRKLDTKDGYYEAQTWNSYKKKYVTDMRSPLRGMSFDDYCFSVNFSHFK